MKQKANYQQNSEKALELLPEPISEIRVQKKNTTRYSLFVDHQFLIGVSEATLTKLNLKKGVEITPSLFHQIEEAENQWAAREYFFRILSRRDHSRKELKDKAYKKGYSDSFVDEILDEFEQKEYIDDQKFARKYVTEKFEFNNWGPYKIRTQLFKKGISKQVTEQIIKEVFGDDAIKESMLALVEKKKQRYRREPEEKRRKKVFDFLMRKGYDSENILKNIDELLALIAQ
ncbi:MAG: RecX family transcriptional regulator [Gracilimonas sp.]|uniref:regulatory protein RecX n=1 Tax=Gracilimonas sp. TaxID=1974203 RepID=UPI0019AA52B9|nr:RecX family transcriptional regulator [Gracilimonas sp.]MBD3616146.1 RecX family transcriptional regulator [Gracilimonas sp.]